jgi:hypothetical protein
MVQEFIRVNFLSIPGKCTPMAPIPAQNKFDSFSLVPAQIEQWMGSGINEFM